jgi:4-hydroxy-3-polyprenylbenzoate decarboxylase
VHPLLLAIGSERYIPYAAVRKPRELLTLANAILGQGQLSLAKYLFLAAREDDPELDIHDIAAFFRHILERFDPEVDLHFQTRTTMDTLDYSAGMGLNAGSKVVVAAAGPKRRSLAKELPAGLKLPDGYKLPRVVLPGVLAIGGPPLVGIGATAERQAADLELRRLLQGEHGLEAAVQYDPKLLEGFPLIVVVDDSQFTAANLSNWLWVAFTRSDPANDIRGVREFVDRKHWGCRGPLVIDARIKPYMAPPLEEDPKITKRVDELFGRGGPLNGIER